MDDYTPAAVTRTGRMCMLHGADATVSSGARAARAKPA